MNRKARRAVGGQERIQGVAVDPRTLQRFNDAVGLHQAGQLSAATEIYRQILADDPTHLRSLQNLGAVAVDTGHYELAIDLFRRAIALDDLTPASHRNIAMALLALGRLDEAIVHGRRAIALKPDYVRAYLILGEALDKLNLVSEALECYGRLATLDPNNETAHTRLGKLHLAEKHLVQADASLERALAIDPKSASAHFYLGNLRSQQGRPQQAVDCYLRAIEIAPEHLETHCNLCAALMAQSKYSEAIAHYRQILVYKPDFADGYCHLATAYLTSGDALGALDAARHALRIADTRHGQTLFVAALRELINSPNLPADDEVLDLFVRAISEAWDRPDQLMLQALAIVRADAEISACIERAGAAWPAKLTHDQLFGPSGFPTVSRHRVFRCMLENGLIGHLATEHFLANARICMLQTTAASVAENLPDDAIRFHVALARQCFINEYVYALTDIERAEVEKLRGALTAALSTRSPIPALWLVAYAAYEPLHTLAGCETLLDDTWSEEVNGLLNQQVREPLEEHRLRSAIPRLTPIDDAMSVAVRDQYEEHPYPRWVKSPLPRRQVTPDQFMRQSFPFAESRCLGKTEDIDLLTAGCGTGQQLMDMSQLITGARAVAVDLSLSSLCYAKRKVDELGLRNIELGHADILRLDALGRSFDIIECGGVLHHLDDPEAGWKVLVSLLRPNGLLRIALYSETARTQIVAAQKLAARHSFGRTTDDIRRFRQEFLANPDVGMVRKVTGILDFYGTSACRDLLFHVSEHRFSLPRIKSFLEANDLKFVAFELPRRVRDQYAHRFSEDAAMDDLDRWHIFEQEHPDTFIGMYQFWVQKTGPMATE